MLNLLLHPPAQKLLEPQKNRFGFAHGSGPFADPVELPLDALELDEEEIPSCKLAF